MGLTVKLTLTSRGSLQLAISEIAFKAADSCGQRRLLIHGVVTAALAFGVLDLKKKVIDANVVSARK